VTSSDNKDKIISNLEDQVRLLDSTIARLSLENKRLKISKAYRLSKAIQSSYGKVHHSIPARAVRKAGRIAVKSVNKNRPPVNQIVFDCYNYDLTKHSQKIKIGIICKSAPVRPQSSAFIRLISPLTTPFTASKVSIRLFDGESASKNYFEEDIDLFIVQRTAFPSIASAQLFLDGLRQHNIPLVVDIDDAISLLDKNHVEYSVQEPSIEAMELIISNANQVWCSTNAIASLCKPLNKNVVIIENTLDPRTWDYSKKQNNRDSQPLQIIYMGTVTHQSDFNMIVAALDRTYALRPRSFELTVIGVSDALPQRPYIKCIRLLPHESVYPKFTRWFSELPAFDIGLSPLEDTPFNNAKSDIKCLDYLALGIIPVVSNLLPYDASPVHKYSILSDNTVSSWTDCLIRLVADKEYLKTQREKALEGQGYVWSMRTSTRAAEQMHELIKELLE